VMSPVVKWAWSIIGNRTSGENQLVPQVATEPSSSSPPTSP